MRRFIPNVEVESRLHLDEHLNVVERLPGKPRISRDSGPVAGNLEVEAQLATTARIIPA
jgi:hypothetical protein